MSDRPDSKLVGDSRSYGPAVTSQQSDDGIRSALTFVRRRLGLLVLTTLLGTAVGAFYGYTRVPVYTAEAKVVIEPKESRVVDVQAVAAGLSTDSSMVENGRGSS